MYAMEPRLHSFLSSFHDIVSSLHIFYDVLGPQLVELYPSWYNQALIGLNSIETYLLLQDRTILSKLGMCPNVGKCPGSNQSTQFRWQILAQLTYPRFLCSTRQLQTKFPHGQRNYSISSLDRSESTDSHKQIHKKQECMQLSIGKI